MIANPIKNNTVVLSLEEYEKLKDELEAKEQKIKDLNSVIKDKGKKILVTRYDINPSPEVQKIFVNYIIETFDRLYGNSANRLYETYAKYGSAAYSMDVQTDDLKHREMCLRQAIESFVKKYMTTTQRADYAKEITKVINFEDVEEEIKSIYNHKYFEEFGERIFKLEQGEKEYEAKVKELDKNSRIQNFKNTIETLKKQLETEKKDHKYDNEKYENIKESLNDDKYKLQVRINTLEKEMRDKDSQLELYRTTIEDQKSLHQYKESKGVFSFFK